MGTEHGLAVDAMLHFATALAVAVYFRIDLTRLVLNFFLWVRKRDVGDDRVLIPALMLGTLPAVVAGFLLEETMDTVFRNVPLVAGVLVFGSGVFLVAEWVHRTYALERPLTVKGGVLIGCFQALALLPGMSRSGATISGGLLLGLSREQAARFGFLLSFPIILGAGSKKLLELGSAGVLTNEWLPILVGALAAFLAGIAAIHYLLLFLKNHTLLVFVAYRLVLAAVVFLLV